MSSSLILGGLKLTDKQSFSWKIENFSVMLSDPKAVDAQEFEFRVGGNDPNISSRWTMYLRTDTVHLDYDDSIKIGVYYWRAADCDCDSTEEVKTECLYTVKNRKTKEVLSGISNGGFSPLNSQRGEVGRGQWTEVENLQDFLADDDSLTIQCTFKLFTKHVRRAVWDTVQESLERFHEKSKTEAQRLFAKLSEKNSSFENIKILTIDNVEIKALKDMLAVRSPVFEAILRSKMKEETEEVIELQDLTANALRVLLHFIYTGELLPNWSNIDILLQLANAAEKYQFPDLLDFFDCILPSLCNVYSAKHLLQTAIQLRLKKAEAGILEFFGKRVEKNYNPMSGPGVVHQPSSSAGGSKPLSGSAAQSPSPSNPMYPIHITIQYPSTKNDNPMSGPEVVYHPSSNSVESKPFSGQGQISPRIVISQMDESNGSNSLEGEDNPSSDGNESTSSGQNTIGLEEHPMHYDNNHTLNGESQSGGSTTYSSGGESINE